MALLEWVLSIVSAWKPAPSLSPVEIEDLICSSDPLGFFFFSSSLEAIFQTAALITTLLENTESKCARSLISPRVADFLVSPFFVVSSEKKCSFLPLSSSPQQRPPDGEPEILQNLSQPSMFCFFEDLFALTAPLRPASHLRGITAPTATVHTSKKKRKIGTVNAEKGICSWALWRPTKYLMW